MIFQAMPHNVLHADVHGALFMRHCLESSPKHSLADLNCFTAPQGSGSACRSRCRSRSAPSSCRGAPAAWSGSRRSACTGDRSTTDTLHIKHYTIRTLAYKALNIQDTLYIKHDIIRTLCITARHSRTLCIQSTK